MWWEFEEGRDRLPAGIHGRHTRGSQHDGLLARACQELAQHRGLASTCAASEEQIALCAGAGGDPVCGRGIDGVGGKAPEETLRGLPVSHKNACRV